jgi:hypothetical protein
MQKKPVISTPQIKSPSTTKMSYSFGNLIFLFLVAVGMFVVYRYVKSLENELKVVRKEMETLKKTEVKPIPQTNNVCSINNNEPTCILEETRKVEEIEDDLESVSSEDIMKIIEDIDSDEKQQVEDQQVEDKHVEDQQVEEPKDVVKEDEIIQEDESEDEIEIQKVKTTDDDLMKKTNEELKQILKEHGKNIKGTKAELVKRITTEVYI